MLYLKHIEIEGGHIVEHFEARKGDGQCVLRKLGRGRLTPTGGPRMEQHPVQKGDNPY